MQCSPDVAGCQCVLNMNNFGVCPLLSTTKHPSGWAATERSIIAFTSRGIAVSVFREKGLSPETTETMERVSFFRALQAQVRPREIEVTGALGDCKASIESCGRSKQGGGLVAATLF